MKKIIQENVQTQDLWTIRGILTIALVFSFENNINYIFKPFPIVQIQILKF
jgi:hypothetical protein